MENDKENSNKSSQNLKEKLEFDAICLNVIQIISSVEIRLRIPAPHPNFSKWYIGYCASPSDLIRNEVFGAYWNVTKLEIAKSIVDKFTIDGMKSIPYERSGENIAVSHIVVKLK